MRRLLASLTRKQILALGLLFLGDLVMLGAAFWVVRDAQSALVAQATLVAPATPVSLASCQARAAELLVTRNLAGTAQFDSDGALRFHLSGLDTAGNPVPRAVEAAWDALAAGLALPQSGCGPYQVVRVDVPNPGDETGSRLLVEADWIDVRAWGWGELDDGELSARLKASTYLSPQAQ